MKRMTFYLLMILALLAFTGCDACKPDLSIKEMSVGWNSPHRLAKAIIVNNGKADAEKFTVYFNAYSNCILQAQTTQNVTSLADGASILVKTDFAQLANPENEYLRNINKIEVVVDPKNMVDESNECNNTQEKIISIQPPRVLIIEKLIMHQTPQTGTWLYCFNAKAVNGTESVFHIPNKEYEGDGITIKMNLALLEIRNGQRINIDCNLDDDESDVCSNRAEDQFNNQIFIASLQGSKTFSKPNWSFTIYWHMQ